MILKDSVYKAVCDGCGKVDYLETPDDVLGYSGTVIHHNEYGGQGGEWFSCSKRCNSRAVLAAVERPRPGDVAA